MTEEKVTDMTQEDIDIYYHLCNRFENKHPGKGLDMAFRLMFDHKNTVHYANMQENMDKVDDIILDAAYRLTKANFILSDVGMKDTLERIDIIFHELCKIAYDIRKATSLYEEYNDDSV